jgi:hypothetical protein
MNNWRRLFWLGLFLEVTGWHLLLPIFSPASRVGLLLIAAGAVVLGVSLRESAPALPRPALLGYALASVVVVIFAPAPGSIGGVFTLSGVVMSLAARSGGRWSGFSFGVILTGIICLLQSALLPLLMSLGSRFHEVPGLAPVVCRLFEFFGYSASWESGTVFVQGSSQVQDYAISSEYFGWIFLVNAACGFAAWQLLCQGKPRLRHFTMFVLSAVVYALARYFLLALLYLDLPLFSLFWNPWVLALSHLPLFALWFGTRWTAVGSTGAVVGVAGASVGRKEALGAVALAAGAFCFVAAWGWEDAGRIKTGRLLIDETHSRWEKINRPYDTQWYGEESGYNYYCLAKFLGYYYRVRHQASRITPALLADCDILIIKTPTASFAPDEIEAIEEFVGRGGGLLLIGDHTNVFGTSKYLNAIAHRFGLHYNYDATYDLPTGGLSFYEKPRLLPHPIVQRLPPFLFGTSCTLEVPFAARIAMNGYALRTAGHDYSARSFFSARTDGPYVTFGLFPQLAAVKFKQGRVVAFTDSTVFSNFWMFIPGKPELLLGCTEWLNRRNAHAALPLAFSILGVLLAAAGALGLRRDGSGSFAMLLAAGTLGVFAGVAVTGAANRASYPQPTPHTRFRTICFDRQCSHFELPDQTLIHDPSVDFSTLYVWVQRVGCVPRVCAKLADSVKQDDGIVMINPSGALSQSDLRRLRDFVGQGGVLFLFDSPGNKRSASSQVLGMFGLALADGLPQSQSISNAAGQLVAAGQNARVATGGTGVLFAAAGEPVLSIKRAGKGAVIFSGDAALFANASLGTVSQVPSETVKRLYEVIFRLFRQVDPKQAAPW